MENKKAKVNNTLMLLFTVLNGVGLGSIIYFGIESIIDRHFVLSEDGLILSIAWTMLSLIMFATLTTTLFTLLRKQIH